MIEFWPTSEGLHIVLIEDCVVQFIGVIWL